MADVNRGNRPLSPHLTIYRKQYTSVTSILARLTGISLLGAVLLVVWWLLAAASGPDYFDCVNGLLTSWFGDLVLTAALWAVWYHFCSGLRHLYWDTGRGFELETAQKLAWGVIIGSVVLTVLTVIIL
ncbi:succinate dehydrogenase, cytochrome b556 subunit [Cochlodiniinecator piscidefendens]|uniref:succinate dehydrogenase, cytochrome b556 subunit n=1 Tax=Cochlodiniinecator piscidefendens TaxID=2715756 RepID=UPI00140CA8E8|nr:succinate dehydrogenase, cytochrome b556 subunit [Cochlodiniinecator piscidefendens]